MHSLTSDSPLSTAAYYVADFGLTRAFAAARLDEAAPAVLDAIARFGRDYRRSGAHSWRLYL